MRWVIQHALRTLIKQGNKETLALLGYPADLEIKVSSIQLEKTVVQMGESLVFDFEVHSESDSAQNLMIDYVIHHMKANGKMMPKVFKLTKKKIYAHETQHFSKNIRFEPLVPVSITPESICLKYKSLDKFGGKLSLNSKHRKSKIVR